ncbi:MAG TPA: hypothetical protein DCM61_03690 [Clostridiales bacterium]|nr:hypothetical protein [Clostridiales bacterium]
MDLFEFEGKKLFAQYGIPVPNARFVQPECDEAPLDYPFMLKAQTLSGGRGKAGGVRPCRDRADFEKNREEILALTIKGKPVCGLLAEEMLSIEREMYLAISLQGSETPKLIASAAGGMEIESLAKTEPDKILVMDLDPFTGLSAEQKETLIDFLSLEQQPEAWELLEKLQNCFFASDALLVEINPLGIVGGRLVALDAKVSLDDHAAFRQQELFASLREDRQPLSHYTEQTSDGTTITFVPLEGDIGLISDGAGTGMLTLDMVTDFGGRVASFCELGGTTPASTMYKAMEYTVLGQKDLKSLLIVLIGGFNRMDDMANGITSFIRDHGLSVPLYVRMVGNMEEEGRRIMTEAGLHTYSSLSETVKMAVKAAEV